MASALLQSAGKSVLSQQLQHYAPSDPYYETPPPQSQGQGSSPPSKSKRRAKPIPPGLSAHDAKILLSIRKRAHRLDTGFTLCGIRFGWTFLIGLIPVIGDLTDFTLNHKLVVKKAEKGLEIPGWLVRKMVVINVCSAVVGSVPFVGDVIVGIWKANSRNVAMLEEYLRLRGEEYLKLRNEGLSAEEILAIPVNKEGKPTEAGAGAGADNGASTTGLHNAGKRRDKKQLRPGHGLKRGEIVPGEAPPPGHEGNSNSRPGFFGSFFGNNGRRRTATPQTEDSGITMTART
ncbi:hypothetical protein AX16_008299 [Volvariella volvacea WC 439]|nr:hypothetical protein AX16_008299 [Volvariella volvacea WC 439]